MLFEAQNTILSCICLSFTYFIHFKQCISTIHSSLALPSPFKAILSVFLDRSSQLSISSNNVNILLYFAKYARAGQISMEFDAFVALLFNILSLLMLHCCFCQSTSELLLLILCLVMLRVKCLCRF